MAGWLLLTFSASATAVFITENDCYAELATPTMAVAAWRVWRHGGWPRQKAALGLYLLQWSLNALWTPLFFGLHRPDWTLAKILVLLAAILAMMRVFWRVDRPAALLLLPYAAWVAFATVLNWTIWRMN